MGSDAESHILLHKLKCCFTSTETVGLLETGAQDVQLDFHTAPDCSVHKSWWPLLYGATDSPLSSRLSALWSRHVILNE